MRGFLPRPMRPKLTAGAAPLLWKSWTQATPTRTRKQISAGREGDSSSRVSRARLRGEPGEVGVVLPFDEVLAALGNRGEKRLGAAGDRARLDRRLVDRASRFDRSSARKPPGFAAAGRASPRRCAVAIAAADRRLSNRRASLRPRRPPSRLGRPPPRPRQDRGLVTEIKSPRSARSQISPRRPAAEKPRAPVLRARAATGSSPLADLDRNGWDYAGLAEGVEAWGFRLMQARASS